MKAKPIPRNTLPKKSITRNAKMAKQKFEFEYHRDDWIAFIINLLSFIILARILHSLVSIFTEANLEIGITLVSVPFLAYFIRGLILPSTILSGLFGYAILHETYLELHLNKTLHIHKYQEIKSVVTVGVRGGGRILIMNIKGKRKIKIGMINSLRKRQKSYLPLSEFEDALNAKLIEIEQTNKQIQAT